MRLIPVKVRDQALLEFDKFDGKPEVLRKWIKDRTQWFTKADAGKPGAAKAHVLDGEEYNMPNLMDEGELHTMESMPDEELCAFVRRKIQQHQRNRSAGGAPKRERTAPPRDKRDITCPNCLKKGHTSQECKAPKVSAQDRKCFSCGEPGHISSKCPNANKARVLTGPAAAEDAKPVWLGCVYDEADVHVHRKKMMPMHKAVVQPPAPRGCTLGDCMGRAFAQMAELERMQDRAGRNMRSFGLPNLGRLLAEYPDPDSNGVSADALASLPLGRPGYRGTPSFVSTDSLASLPSTGTGTGWTGRPGYRGASPRATSVRQQREEDRDWECYKAAFRGDGMMGRESTQGARDVSSTNHALLLSRTRSRREEDLDGHEHPSGARSRSVTPAFPGDLPVEKVPNLDVGLTEKVPNLDATTRTITEHSSEDQAKRNSAPGVTLESDGGTVFVRTDCRVDARESDGGTVFVRTDSSEARLLGDRLEQHNFRKILCRSQCQPSRP